MSGRRKFYNHVDRILTDINSLIRKFINELDGVTQFSGVHIIYGLSNDNTIALFCSLRNIPKANTKTRRVNSIKKEHIFFNGLIKDHPSGNGLLESYATEIAYCTNIDHTHNNLECITGYHYDVSRNGEINHPLFHVQQNSSTFERIFVKERTHFNGHLGDNLSCTSQENNAREIRTIRIPTPQMDLFSALISTLADYIVIHENKDHQEAYLSLLNELNKKIIPVSFEPLTYVGSDFKAQNKNIGQWYPSTLKSA